MRKIIGNTGRIALGPDGQEIVIYEAYFVGGMLDGATFEVLETELADDEKVTVRVTNDYEDGHHSVHEAEVAAPGEGYDPDDLDEWWEEECFRITGDGHGADKDLGYCFTMEIIKAADPALVGKEVEWSGK